MDRYEELEKINKLKENGIISDEEFEIRKKKILSNLTNKEYIKTNINVIKNKKITHKFLIILFVFILLITNTFMLSNILKNKKVNNENIINQEQIEIEENRLENLNFDIVLNKDNSMQITETWEIAIKEVNTLFKTFTLDDNFKDVLSVKVSEVLKNGESKELNEINTEMYYVTKDSYYALINGNGNFEIAWGVSAKNEIKTYKISYTIPNAVKVYNDCAELNWYFIGEKMEIPITNINGNIIIENIDMSQIKVWKHSDTNSEIKIEDNKVSFSGFEIEKEKSFRVRLLLPKEVFDNSNSINKSMKNKIINEEKAIEKSNGGTVYDFIDYSYNTFDFTETEIINRIMKGYSYTSQGFKKNKTTFENENCYVKSTYNGTQTINIAINPNNNKVTKLKTGLIIYTTKEQIETMAQNTLINMIYWITNDSDENYNAQVLSELLNNTNTMLELNVKYNNISTNMVSTDIEIKVKE